MHEVDVGEHGVRRRLSGNGTGAGVVEHSEHGLDRRNQPDRRDRFGPIGGTAQRTDELAININRAPAHSLSDAAGPPDDFPGNLHHDEVGQGTGLVNDTENIHGEFLNDVAGHNGSSDAGHADLDFVQE